MELKELDSIVQLAEASSAMVRVEHPATASTTTKLNYSVSRMETGFQQSTYQLAKASSVIIRTNYGSKSATASARTKLNVSVSRNETDHGHPAPTMKSTLHKLYLEIRHIIYEYLLDSRTSTTYTRSQKWRTMYTTGLFYTCKDLSRETLQYFYSINAFVAVETEIKSEAFIGAVKSYIVCHPTTRAKFPSNCALKFKVSVSKYSTFDNPKEAWVIAGRDLRLLKLILACEFQALERTEYFQANLTLSWRDDMQHYKSNLKTTKMWFDAMRGIYLMPRGESGFQNQIKVDLWAPAATREYINILANFCKSTIATPEYWLSQARFTRAHAYIFHRQGDVSISGAYLMTSIRLLRRCNLKDGSLSSLNPLFEAIHTLGINLHHDMARFYCGHRSDHTANKSLYAARRALGLFVKWSTRKVDRKIFMRVGNTYMSLGKLADACAIFSKALTVHPEDKTFTSKLEEAEKKRQGQGRFIIDLTLDED